MLQSVGKWDPDQHVVQLRDDPRLRPETIRHEGYHALSTLRGIPDPIRAELASLASQDFEAGAKALDLVKTGQYPPPRPDAGRAEAARTRQTRRQLEQFVGGLERWGRSLPTVEEVLRGTQVRTFPAPASPWEFTSLWPRTPIAGRLLLEGLEGLAQQVGLPPTAWRRLALGMFRSALGDRFVDQWAFQEEAAAMNCEAKPVADRVFGETAKALRGAARARRGETSSPLPALDPLTLRGNRFGVDTQVQYSMGYGGVPHRDIGPPRVAAPGLVTAFEDLIRSVGPLAERVGPRVTLGQIDRMVKELKLKARVPGSWDWRSYLTSYGRAHLRDLFAGKSMPVGKVVVTLLEDYYLALRRQCAPTFQKLLRALGDLGRLPREERALAYYETIRQLCGEPPDGRLRRDDALFNVIKSHHDAVTQEAKELGLLPKQISNPLLAPRADLPMPQTFRMDTFRPEAAREFYRDARDRLIQQGLPPDLAERYAQEVTRELSAPRGPGLHLRVRGLRGFMGDPELVKPLIESLLRGDKLTRSQWERVDRWIQDAQEALSRGIERDWSDVLVAQRFGRRGAFWASLRRQVAREFGPVYRLDNAVGLELGRLGPTQDAVQPATWWEQFLMGINVLGDMGFSAIGNLTQVADAMILGGLRDGLRGAYRALFSADREAAAHIGVGGTNALEAKLSQIGARGMAGRFLQLTGFSRVESFNRSVAGMVGMEQAETLAALLRRGKLTPRRRAYVDRWLDRLGIDPKELAANGNRLTPDMLATAALRAEDLSQYTYRGIAFPAWAGRTPLGRMAWQLYRFVWQRGRFLTDVILREASHGNVMPLALAVVLWTAFGEAAQDAYTVLSALAEGSFWAIRKRDVRQIALHLTDRMERRVLGRLLRDALTGREIRPVLLRSVLFNIASDLSWIDALGVLSTVWESAFGVSERGIRVRRGRAAAEALTETAIGPTGRRVRAAVQVPTSIGAYLQYPTEERAREARRASSEFASALAFYGGQWLGRKFGAPALGEALGVAAGQAARIGLRRQPVTPEAQAQRLQDEVVTQARALGPSSLTREQLQDIFSMPGPVLGETLKQIQETDKLTAIRRADLTDALRLSRAWLGRMKAEEREEALMLLERKLRANVSQGADPEKLTEAYDALDELLQRHLELCERGR